MTNSVLSHLRCAPDEATEETNGPAPRCATCLLHVWQSCIGASNASFRVENGCSYVHTDCAECLNVSTTLTTSSRWFSETQIDAFENRHVPVGRTFKCDAA